MPTLPLASGALDGDVPVTSVDDVEAELPGSPAPVRTALLTALAAGLVLHQDLAAYAAAQGDPTRATGPYLTGLGEDRGIVRQTGQDIETYRARVLSVEDQVTPAAVLAAANRLLAPYTTVLPQYIESVLDRFYVFDGVTDLSMRSYIGASPDYPDRLYPQDAGINGGAFRPQSDPGKAWTFSDMVGRAFVLRVPDISTASAYVPMVMNGTGELDTFASDSLGTPGMYVADGTNADGGSEADGTTATFLFTDTTTATSVYEAIGNELERLRGHSIRWTMIVDSDLT